MRVLQYQWQLWCLGTNSSKNDRKMKFPLKPRKLWELWTEILGITSFNRSSKPKNHQVPQKESPLFSKWTHNELKLKTIENLLHNAPSQQNITHCLQNHFFSKILKRSKIEKPVRILKVGRRYQYEPRPPSLPKLKKYHLVYLSKRILTRCVKLKILYESRMLAGHIHEPRPPS